MNFCQLFQTRRQGTKNANVSMCQLSITGAIAAGVRATMVACDRQ